MKKSNSIHRLAFSALIAAVYAALTMALGFMSYNADVIDADRRGLSPYDCSPEAVDEVRAIKAVIDSQE